MIEQILRHKDRFRTSRNDGVYNEGLRVNDYYLVRKNVYTRLALSSFRLVWNRIWPENVKRQIPDKPE